MATKSASLPSLPPRAGGDNDDDDTSDDNEDDGSGDDGSVGEETEDAAFHRATREIMNRVGQWVGTAVMDWGGGNGW